MVVLAAIASIGGVQPRLTATLFALAAAPSFATFVLLPAINNEKGALALACVWAASVAALVSLTGGTTSVLAAGFAVVVAQGFGRPWWVLTCAMSLLAYFVATAVGGVWEAGAASRVWEAMMVVAYLAHAGWLAAAPPTPSGERVERRIAEVAHELRTPLTHILGFSEMIERQVFGPLNEKYVEYASLIRTSGAHLLALANDMLDLSRIDADRYPLAIERFDVKAVAREVVRLSSVSAAMKSIELAVDDPDTALMVRADRQALTRILFNTIGNGLKFTPEHGRVRLHAASLDGALVLDTIDNGPGIPRAERERLGAAYERGAGGLGVEGAGLGLSLVRALAVLHGGTLSFHDAPGGGALVRVTLPVLATE